MQIIAITVAFPIIQHVVAAANAARPLASADRAAAAAAADDTVAGFNGTGAFSTEVQVNDAVVALLMCLQLSNIDSQYS